MKRLFTRMMVSGVFVVGFTACSNKIVGTWTIQKYENAAPDEQGYSLSNIGTITFNKNGNGEKNIRYSVLGTTHTDMYPFQWKSAEESITISGDSTELSKTWIIVSNKRNFQQWKSTNGNNKVQVMELRKN